MGKLKFPIGNQEYSRENCERKDWSLKLEDTLWAYKTPIGSTPFNLVCGISCHLPVELEYKALWATQQLNFDHKAAGERVNELDVLRLNAYEGTLIYKFVKQSKLLSIFSYFYYE